MRGPHRGFCSESQAWRDEEKARRNGPGTVSGNSFSFSPISRSLSVGEPSSKFCLSKEIVSSVQSVLEGSGNSAGILEHARSRTGACIQMRGRHTKMSALSSPFPSIVPSSSSLVPSSSLCHASQSEAMRTSCSFSTQSFSSGVGSSGGCTSNRSNKHKNDVSREMSSVSSQNNERSSSRRSTCRRNR